MDPIAIDLLKIVGALFAVAAVWIAFAWRGRHRETRIWTVYFVEVGIVSSVLVPAYLGAAGSAPRPPCSAR